MLKRSNGVSGLPKIGNQRLTWEQAGRDTDGEIALHCQIGVLSGHQTSLGITRKHRIERDRDQS